MDPNPYNQLLIELLLIVPECYFAEIIETRVEESQAHFSLNVVSPFHPFFSVNFGYQFEMILSFAITF